MVSLTADLVGDAGAGPEQGTLASGNREGHWSLLNQLENTGIGARLSDGSTQVRRREPVARPPRGAPPRAGRVHSLWALPTPARRRLSFEFPLSIRRGPYDRPA